MNKTITQILDDNKKLKCAGLRESLNEDPACFDGVTKTESEWLSFRGVGCVMISLLRDNGYVSKPRETYGLPDRLIVILDSFGVGLDKKSVGDALKSGLIPKPINGAGFRKHNTNEKLPCYVTVGSARYKALRVYAFGHSCRPPKLK